MDRRDWEILKALYQTNNMTKAANQLFMSQPAFSKRIHAIEEAYQVTVVKRTSSGVSFTKSGEIIVEYCEKMLLEDEELRRKLQGRPDENIGTLKIGLSNYVTRKIPPILKAFREKYPQISFEITTDWSDIIHKKVLDQGIQIGFVRGDYSWSDQKICFLEESIAIVSKEQFELSELPKMTRIDYHCDSKLQNTIDDWWKQCFDAPPLIGLKVDKSDTCLMMVENGLGYAILPSTVIQNADSKIFQQPLTYLDGKEITRNSWIMYRTADLKNPVVQAFVSFLNDWDWSL